MTAMRCNRCHRPMPGTTAYDGACECGGLIEAVPVGVQPDPAAARLVSGVAALLDRYGDAFFDEDAPR